MSQRWIIVAVVVIAVLLLAAVSFIAFTVSNEVLTSFQRVNEGLETTRQTLDEKRIGERAMLGSMGCAELIAQADSLHLSYNDLGARIDSFKVRLLLAPMDDTSVADSVFRADDRGRNLYLSFHAFFDMAERISGSDSTDQRIQVYAANVRSTTTLEHWRELNFFHMPRVACITILSKFRSDAASAELLVIRDLLERCAPNGRDH